MKKSAEPQTLSARILEQAARHPQNPAVRCGSQSLSYEELDIRSQTLARILCAHGAGPGRMVAVDLDRSVDLIVALLAVLRSGAAWLPLDPAYPPDRRRFMMTDSRAPLCIGRGNPPEEYGGDGPVWIHIDQLDALPEAAPEPPGPDDPAYVIYTSGSTGKPKGVVCRHRGVLHLLDDARRCRPLGPGDRCSWWTSLCFDVSVYEIFSPLVAGAELVIVPDRLRIDAERWMDWLAEERITAAYIPPMMTADLASWTDRHPGRSRLRRILTGVEPIPETRLARIVRAVPDLCLINGYGPTEATVYCTCYVVPASGEPHRTTPIGTAVGRSTIHLLDEALRPVPDGQEGELFVGGPQLAAGYLNRPRLTAERFPQTPYGRLYRTGDRAVRLPDGNLLFAGRNDAQFKFNGYRIEPGEIETALCTLEPVREAAVTVREDPPGIRRLLAYYTVEAGGDPTPETLRAALAAELPEYMVPSLFIRIPQIPLTPNGKTDREALPEPSPDDLEPLRAAEFLPPRTETEQQLATWFSEFLGVRTASRSDHFFSLGGHSLLATRLLAEIQDTLQADLSLADLYEHPVLESLAARIDTQRKTAPAEPIPPAPAREAYPLTPSQRVMWLQHHSDRSGTLANIPELIRIHGPLRPDRLEQAFNEVIARHDALRMVFGVQDGEPVQRPLDAVQIHIPLTDLSRLDIADRERRIDEIRRENSRQVFDLSTGPLLRAELVKIADRQHDLYLTVHHIAIDGWGLSLLNSEIATVYEALTENRKPVLPPPTCRYIDVAVWMEQRFQSGQLDRQLAYWKKRLAPPRPDLHFPLDHDRPAVSAHRGARCAFTLPPALTARLNALARQNSATLFMVLTALWQSLLQRATGSADIITGTAIANRNRSQTAHVIGTFINALALRTSFADNPLFSELIARVRRTALDAYAHQDVPFEQVMEAVGDGSRHPVFRNSLILHNMPLPPKHFGGLRMTDDEVGNETAKMDLLLYFIERDGQLEGQLEYDAELFDPASAENIVADFRHLAGQVVQDPDRTPADCLETGRDTAPTCFIIGEGSLCLRCAEILRRRGVRILGLISPDAANRRTARRMGIAGHDPAEDLAGILSAQPFDYLFSIVNSIVLKEDVLRLPRRAAINYHDSPLPRYAGMYATAWALMNRERYHGITWHQMTEQVDAGDILKQRTVEIRDDDTSFTLNARCYDAAAGALEELAVELVEHRAAAVPQDLSRRTCNGLYQRPANGGLIDWRWPRDQIDAFRRALDFGHQPNELVLPKVLFGGELFILHTDGSLSSPDGGDCDLRLPAVGEPARWLVNEPGFEPLARRLEKATGALCRHERFWVRCFEQARPLELPEGTGGDARLHRMAEQPLFLCFLARFCSQDGFTVGLRVHTDLPAAFSDTVPLNVRLDADRPLAENIERAAAALERCARHQTFARDLFLRMPHLQRPPAWPVVLDAAGVRCPHRLRAAFRAFRQHAELDLPLADQSLLTARDRQMLARLEAPAPGFSDTRCIHQLFEEQVRRTPDRVAVEGAEEQLTYAELNRRADVLAARLQRQGAGPDRPVGLCLHRSPGLCVGLLGILKAGAAYVPLDPDYPPDRLRFMAADAALALLVTRRNPVPLLEPDGTDIVCIDDPADEKAEPEPMHDAARAACIFYTSGSTGRPKGVVVEHRNLVNHCRASIRRYGIQETDRILQFFSINFDGSVEELFPAWACGATVVLRPDELAGSITGFEHFVDKHRISVVDLPTAYWHEWVRRIRQIPESLRTVIVGGEKLSAELGRVWLQKGGARVRLFNTYGPTECTVVATVQEVHGHIGDTVPIGTPIAGTAVKVADDRGRSVPPGLSGELRIGGAGVARGYLNRPDLTAEKFVSDPVTGERLYRTGDLVRWNDDGILEFLGRVDDQVKIRGFRIEPGEIAAVIEQHPGVVQAVVIARDDLSERKELAAYCIPGTGAEPDCADLHRFLADRLPEYMLPSAWMMLDEFPVAPGGKIDRRALPVPGRTAPHSRTEHVPPATPQQKILADIWQDVLGIESVGIRDNFFDLGGHSLLAIQLVERVLSAGMSLTVAQLFQSPTIEAMAATVQTRSDREYKSLVRLQEGAKGRPPLFLIHSAPGDLLGYANLVHHLPDDLPVFGFQSLGLADPDHVHDTIPQMAAHYADSLDAFMPEGPVLLAGWCYGGQVAMELARQLGARGRDVRLLGLIDAWAWPPAERRIAFYIRRLRLARIIGLRPWLRIITGKIRSLLNDRTADAAAMLEGVQMKEGVLANREEVYRRNRQAALRYRTRFYPGRVTLFRSDELDDRFLPDMTMEWAALTADQDVNLIPGGHRDMLRSPHVKVLADRLAERMDQALEPGASAAQGA